MGLIYTVTIGNNFDDTIKVILILSKEVLIKNCNSLSDEFLKLNYGEFILKVENSKIIINSWGENDFQDLEKLKKLLI
tara:strand:+ start:191 stop:424 length:234 start_codon:yes stop_codon:yes gene_type:complete